MRNSFDRSKEHKSDYFALVDKEDMEDFVEDKSKNKGSVNVQINLVK